MKIMLCIDDDSQYDALLDAVSSMLAADEDDEVVLTHVVATLRWTPFKGNDSGWAGVERGILEKVDDFLERTVERLAGNDVRVEALRLEGDIAAEIAKAADARDVDVIAAGAIGQARSQDFLVGSVAEKLLSASGRDLLLVRGPAPSADKELRVTVAIDDTDACYHAMQSFAEKFRVERAAVEIVHVMRIPPPRYDAAPEGTHPKSSAPPIVQQRADDAVNRAETLFSSRGLHPRLALRRGEPAREVLEAARGFDADLIVVGRGASNARKTGTRLDGWRGTVTKRVAQHAPCSVFIAAADLQPDVDTNVEKEPQRR